MRCSCYMGTTTVSDCPQHGQRTHQPATGTPSSGDSGVPVVDLTATINDLLRHADEVRQQANDILVSAHGYATSLRREAAYLESLATTLAGMTGGSDDE